MHVPCLNFNGPKLSKKLMHHSEVCTKEVIRYINLVNRVLDLHKCPILEEFSISFPFLQSTSSYAEFEVYKWLRFASSRKIQSLKLDLSVDIVNWPSLTGLCDYSFPIELLVGFNALKMLTLDNVMVDCQGVESLLSSCPVLEFLCIRESASLHHVKVVGPSLKLKHLVIWKCPIFSMEIRNVNLLSFTFRGVTPNFLFENVTSVLKIDINLIMYRLLFENAPRITTNFTHLVMLSVVGNHTCTVSNFLPVLRTKVASLYLSEIHLNEEPSSGGLFFGLLCFQHLHLVAYFPTYNNLKLILFDTFQRDHFGGSLSTLNNLKWLTVRLNYVFNSSLLRITPLLEAAPYLQKFTIELHRNNKVVQEGSISRKTVKSPHQHLTEVHYRGYLGATNDVELATYLLENTVMLEKFIADPCVDVKDIRENCEETQRARHLAMLQLQPKVAKGVKLVII